MRVVAAAVATLDVPPPPLLLLLLHLRRAGGLAAVLVAVQPAVGGLVPVGPPDVLPQGRQLVHSDLEGCKQQQEGVLILGQVSSTEQ